MNTPQIKTPPFCKNCSNFIDVGDVDNSTGDAPRCRKFPMLDVVIGEKFFVACHAVRSQDAPCGIEGKMFQPKIEMMNDGGGEVVQDGQNKVEPDKTNLN